MGFSVPIEFKPLVYLASGLAIAVLFLAIPRKTLQKIGKLPALSPNWITFWRLPLTAIGYLIYFKVDPFAGFCIIVVAYTLDRMDGKMATVLSELNDPLHPGKTPTGEWLDPLIDKLTFLPPMFIFWWKGILFLPFIMVMIAAELTGTIIRRPFNLFQDYVRTNAASGFSKMKAFIQLICLLVCIPLDQHWMDFSLAVPNVLLGLATVFAGLSVTARLRLGKETEKVIDEMTGVFSHRE